MQRRLAVAALLAAVTCAGGSGPLRPAAAHAAGLAVQQDTDDAKIRQLLQQVEQAAQKADRQAYLDLLAGSADRTAANNFTAIEFRPSAGRVVIQERERLPLQGTLPGNGYSLTVDAFLEYGDRARIGTWQLDVKRVDEVWRIAGVQRLSAVENLYRLSLNPKKQFDARNFTILSEDIELTLVDGSVFVVDTNDGVTALVLMGRGEMKFQPAPETEKGQLRIFGGADTLESRFDAAFVRVGTLDAHADRSVAVPLTGKEGRTAWVFSIALGLSPDASEVARFLKSVAMPHLATLA